MVGGSADLTGSNNTDVKGIPAVRPGDYAGRYVHWGVREHGMAAAMNGMALHGGIIPYSGTFLVFADYLRPSLRLAALMHQRVIHVLTHDSIGLGEDGPTHQPVEHLASLRAIPNLAVFRPAMRWKPPSAGRPRSAAPTAPRCWPCPARACQRCARKPARTAACAAATCCMRRMASAR
jgi:transketolase